MGKIELDFRVLGDVGTNWADRRKPELLFDRGLSEYGGFGNL